MKVLVVGGSGMIGGSAALHLKGLGHEVAIASRRPAEADSDVAGLPLVQGSYTDESITKQALSAFDAIVFSASADPRHMPAGVDADAFWTENNTLAIPRFLERARDAGVSRVVNIGSYYPWAAPRLLERNAYIRMRLDVDNAVKALNAPGFRTVSLNPPYVLGTLKGPSGGSYLRILQYIRGQIPDLDFYVPPGGNNYMSARSLSEAIAGALDQGDGGVSYLVGDENLSYQDYLSLYLRALGDPRAVPLVEKKHPIFTSFAGYGGTLYYEPEPTPFPYTRGDVARVVKEIVETF
jgi:dihydroflavonol-4-reductase